MDFHSTSVQMYFVDRSGKSTTVQGILSGAGRIDDLQNVSFISDVNIKVSILTLTQVKVVIDPPWPEAVKLLKSGVLGLGFGVKSDDGSRVGGGFDLASTSGKSIGLNWLCIRASHGGRKGPIYKTIQMPPELDISSSGIGITLNGIGMLFDRSKTSKKKVYQKKTGKEILTELAGTDVSVVINPDDAQAQQALGEIQDLVHNKADLEQFRKITERSGCVVIDRGISGDDPSARPVFEIVSRSKAKSGKAKYTFVLFKQVAPENNVFPILEMNTQINNVLLGQTFGFDAKTLKKESKETTDESDSTVGSKEAGKLMGGKANSANKTTAGEPPPDAKDERVKIPIVSRIEKTTKDVLTGLVASAIETSFQYELTVPFIPDLQPGEIVRVSIADPQGGDIEFLSGTYDLWAIEHSINTGGATSKLTLARTGGIAAMAASGIQAIKDTGAKIVAPNSNAKTPISL